MKKNITTEPKTNTNINKEEKEMKIDTKICECCGKEIAIENAKLAHRIPLSEGGKNDFTNMILLCEACYKGTEDYSIEVEEAEKKVRAAEQERLAKQKSEEEAAEEVMQEKVDDLVEKFFEETDVDSIAYHFIDTYGLLDDYLSVLLEDCDNRLSFKDYLLGDNVIDYCWAEYELRTYAENEGFDEAEATMFVGAFTCGEVRGWLDYDIAQAVLEHVMND